MHEVPPTPGNILHRADLVRRRQPLKYLVIDPYLFVEAQSGKGETETQSIKSMLTRNCAAQEPCTTPASPADVMKSMRAKRNVVVTMVNPYGDVASHIRLCEAIHTYA